MSKPAYNRINMIGQKFNKWLIISHLETVGKIPYYKAICTGCDTEHRVDGRNVRNGLSRQCRECGLKEGHKKQTGQVRLKEEPKQTAMRYLFYSKRKSAKKRGIAWKLTLEEFSEIIFKPCFYTGLPPHTTVNPIKNQGLNANLEKNGTITYNGIDRVDSNKGYTIDNVVPCCEAINKAKLCMSQEEFYNLIKTAYIHLGLGAANETK